MFIVTGGAGFIGSALVWELNQHGIEDILVIDLEKEHFKQKNLEKRAIGEQIHRDETMTWLNRTGQSSKIEAIFHLGACSSTTETDVVYLTENNVHYSMRLWEYCSKHRIPFIYASSAATYGDGKLGFSDDPDLTPKLKPLNEYGISKKSFDVWAQQQTNTPPYWAGLRFFNVYGPQEYHKGSQASVIEHFVPQVQLHDTISLFASARSDISDGEQKRDFVYVKDCTKVMMHLFENHTQLKSGIFNCGTGKGRSFNDVAKAVFKTMDKKAHITYIPTPKNLVEHYQYFTEADLSRLREIAKYTQPFTTIENGVNDYVGNYLLASEKYL